MASSHSDSLFCFLTVSIAIRCMQFDCTLRLDAMPKEAEKLWTDYILNVCTYAWLLICAYPQNKLSLLHSSVLG